MTTTIGKKSLSGAIQARATVVASSKATSPAGIASASATEDFPYFAHGATGHRAFAVLPLLLGDRATGALALAFGLEPPMGSRFEILTNTGSMPITGTFRGMDEGAVFSQGSYRFQITYQGGTGSNSVVLTRLA